MTYRQATQSDIPKLVHIRADFLREGFPNMTNTELQKMLPLFSDYFNHHLSRDMFVFGAFSDDDDMMASVFLQVTEKPMNPNFPTGRIGTLLNVYTRPKHRRLGHAHALMLNALAKAKTLKLDYVELSAMDDGLPLYEKLGFVKKEDKYVQMIYHLQD